MPTVIETSAFTPTVYELATTDPLLGGPSGPANTGVQNLANRTRYLYDRLVQSGLQAGKAVLFTGDLNTLRAPGFFTAQAASTNKPGTVWGHLIVTGNDAFPDAGISPVGLQMFFSSEGVFTRQIVGGSWNGWEQLVTVAMLNARNAAPAGSMMAFAGTTAPTGWFFAHGQIVSRSVYPALFAAIGTTYGAGDGSTSFQLPDMRGEFLRGADAGRGIDVGRVLGSAQADAIGAHTHGYQDSTGDGFDVAGNGTAVDIPRIGGTDVARTTGSTGGTETRPRNVAMNFILRY